MMLEQLSHTTDALYLRAVRPSHEGVMRPADPSRTAARSEAQTRVEQRVSEAVRQRRQNDQAVEQHKNSDRQQVEARPPSQASMMADKLREEVVQARRERARETNRYNDNAEGRRQVLERTYQNNPPIQSARFIDEIA